MSVNIVACPERRSGSKVAVILIREHFLSNYDNINFCVIIADLLNQSLLV